MGCGCGKKSGDHGGIRAAPAGVPGQGSEIKGADTYPAESMTTFSPTLVNAPILTAPRSP